MPIPLWTNAIRRLLCLATAAIFFIVSSFEASAQGGQSPHFNSSEVSKHNLKNGLHFLPNYPDKFQGTAFSMVAITGSNSIKRYTSYTPNTKCIDMMISNNEFPSLNIDTGENTYLKQSLNIELTAQTISDFKEGKYHILKFTIPFGKILHIPIALTIDGCPRRTICDKSTSRDCRDLFLYKVYISDMRIPLFDTLGFEYNPDVRLDEMERMPFTGEVTEHGLDFKYNNLVHHLKRRKNIGKSLSWTEDQLSNLHRKIMGLEEKLSNIESKHQSSRGSGSFKDPNLGDVTGKDPEIPSDARSSCPVTISREPQKCGLPNRHGRRMFVTNNSQLAGFKVTIRKFWTCVGGSGAGQRQCTDDLVKRLAPGEKKG